MKKIIYTLGYQGLSIEAYSNLLKSTGVNLVFDVREKAWSRKPGFSKSQMQTALAQHGINYVHLSFLGNPAENRNSAQSTQECLEAYREYLRRNPELLTNAQEVLNEAAQNGINVCLTCFEKLPEECHRSIIVEFLEKLDETLSVIHLGEAPPKKANLPSSTSDTTNRRSKKILGASVGSQGKT